MKSVLHTKEVETFFNLVTVPKNHSNLKPFLFNLKIKMYETHGNIGRGTKGKISMSRFHSIIPGPHMHGLAIESIEESQGGPFRPPNNRRASKRHLSVYVAGATPTQDSFLKGKLFSES